jgi:hypothetical protein
MEPEGGCLWVYGTADDEMIAFTDSGIEYLRELVAEHKRKQATQNPGPITNA